jgi:hypothetical protein
MQKFLSSITSDQVLIVIGLLSPLLHLALGKIKSFSTTHNWILSFLIPFVLTVGAFLATNTNFNHFVPAYASTYATAQAFYFVAVRWWKQYQTLQAQVDSMSSPATEVTL